MLYVYTVDINRYMEGRVKNGFFGACSLRPDSAKCRFKAFRSQYVQIGANATGAKSTFALQATADEVVEVLQPGP